MPFIYKITSPSNKVYIGSTTKKNCEDRWKNYKNLTCKTQPKLYRSFLKYGVINHIFEIIEECTIEDMFKREVEYGLLFDVLDKNKGLNLRLPKTFDKGVFMSQETKDKISKSLTGKKKVFTEEGLKRYLNRKTDIHTEESRKKIGNALRGRTISDKIKKDLSKKCKTKKKVIQYDLNNNYINTFESIAEAARLTNTGVTNISKCIKGIYKYSNNFIWKKA
jgi:group I intron endonuclease